MKSVLGVSSLNLKARYSTRQESRYGVEYPDADLITTSQGLMSSSIRGAAETLDKNLKCTHTSSESCNMTQKTVVLSYYPS